MSIDSCQSESIASQIIHDLIPNLLAPMYVPEANPEFESLLDYLKHHRGCDLTGYKRPSLVRRFGHRMRSLDINSYQTYLEYLQQHSEEYLALLNDVLINVTSFFRDSDAWSSLASDLLPKIIAEKQPDEPIRVWSAGCAAGQEIYSVLILLAEALGVETCLQRVQCYGTDADKVAVQQARQGIYSSLEVANISADRLKKHFVSTAQGYVFSPQLRRTVVFGQHNLENDPPISRIDLLLCRNVLIYFKPEAQAAILIRLHFALKNTGFLLLGNSEALINHRRIFTPLSWSHRIYAKGLSLNLEEHLSINSKSAKKEFVNPLPIQNYFWQTAFEASPIAQLAVDLNGYLMASNNQANLLFGLTLDDWNRPFQDLEPGKLIAAHATAKITLHRRPIALKSIAWQTSQSIQYFDVTIALVLDHKKQRMGSLITFVAKTEAKLLQEKLHHSNAELSKVSQALQDAQLELEAAQQEIQILSQMDYE